MSLTYDVICARALIKNREYQNKINEMDAQLDQLKHTHRNVLKHEISETTDPNVVANILTAQAAEVIYVENSMIIKRNEALKILIE